MLRAAGVVQTGTGHLEGFDTTRTEALAIARLHAIWTEASVASHRGSGANERAGGIGACISALCLGGEIFFVNIFKELDI